LPSTVGYFADGLSRQLT